MLPGNALAELVENDRVIGGVSPSCAEAARGLYESFVEGECHLTDARTAEMVKLSENAFRDVNIAFANEMSVVCDALGVDPWAMIRLANKHPRVDILPARAWGRRPLHTCRPLVHRALGAGADAPDTGCEGGERREARVGGAQGGRNVLRLRRPRGCVPWPRVQERHGRSSRESRPFRWIRGIRRMFDGPIMVVEPHLEALPEELLSDGPCELVDLQTALEAAHVVVLLTDHSSFLEVDPRSLDGKKVLDSRGVWSRR